MAKYRITAPDGGTYEVTAPDDASEADVLAYAQQNYQGASKPDFSNVHTSMSTRQEGWKPGAARSTMLGARDVIEGAGGLLGMVGGDAFNSLLVDPVRRAFHSPNLSDLVKGEAEFQPTPSYRESASRLADSIGLPKPSTAGERVLSDVGQGLTGTALTMGAGSLMSGGGQIAQRAGDLLTAQPRLQAISAATGSGAAGVTRESGGGQGAQLLAAMAGGLAPGAAATGTAATLRGMVRGRSGEQMQRTIEDFNRLGASPSVGQASGRWGAQGAESLLAGGPTSAGVMTRFAERQAEDIGSGLQRMADDLSRNASAERAGRAIERGTELFGRNTGATKRALYWQADQLIPEQTPVGLSNTWQAVDRLTTPTQGATATTGALINPRIAQLRQTLANDLAAGGGQIPYAALKRIRTDIGEAISDYSLSPDTPTRELKQLYAALSRDMEAAAQGQGPQAVQAVRRANNYTRAVADRMEQVQRVIDRNGGPERVFQAAMSGTKDGGTTLRAVMQSLPADGQRAVTAAVIKRMGMPTAGQAGLDRAEEFSAGTFMTNWGNMSAEAKRALFDRYGPRFSQDMDTLARVANNIKRGSKVYSNPSGTANREVAQAYAIGLPLSVAQAPLSGHYWPVALTIGGGISANVAARAMTSPLVVGWLARSTEMPRGSIIPSLQNMARLAEGSGDEAAAEYARALLENQPDQAPNQGSNGN